MARGQLDRQKLENEKSAERERAVLLELQASTAAVESTGQAKAEAQAHAEKSKIECQSEIEGDLYHLTVVYCMNSCYKYAT